MTRVAMRLVVTASVLALGGCLGFGKETGAFSHRFQASPPFPCRANPWAMWR